jgi:hypothetical protein
MPERSSPQSNLFQIPMRLCNLPPVDPFDRFSVISRSKQRPRRGRLHWLRRRIHNDFASFAAHAADVTRLVPSAYTDREKADLLHCYEPPVLRLSELVAAIRDAQPTEVRFKCPYCWVNSPDPFDHYLPKETFPAFAVHAFNILPICTKCNEIKGHRYLIDGRKKFIDLYRDGLPEGRYLCVTLNVIDGVPRSRFHLHRPAAFTDEQYRLLTSHFNGLGLLQRFSERSVEIFTESRRTVRTHLLTQTRDEIKKHFRDEAVSLFNQMHPNYWVALVHEAISASDPLIDFCLEPGPAGI